MRVAPTHLVLALSLLAPGGALAQDATPPASGGNASPPADKPGKAAPKKADGTPAKESEGDAKKTAPSDDKAKDASAADGSAKEGGATGDDAKDDAPPPADKSDAPPLPPPAEGDVTPPRTDEGVDAADAARIKAQIKEELRAELRQEMQADMEAAARDAANQRAATLEWEEERWVEEVKPKLNFLEFNGYFRSRFDYLHGLSLGTFDPLIGRGTSAVPPPTLYRPFDGEEGCEENGEPNDFPGQICEGTVEDTSTLVNMNMRLRLDPTLNVSEDIRIRSTVDIFDNLVLGSTPEAKPGFANNPTLPLPVFAASQNPVEAGFNSIFDAIRIKRLWAEVMTPFGQLRVGRQPQNFGLGLVANAGNGLDNDYGDNADQILFATRVAGHYLIPAYSISSAGPNARGGGAGVGGDNGLQFLQGEGGQRINLDPRDDVHSVILSVLKKEKEEDIEEQLRSGGAVLNYGFFFVYRHQGFDVPDYYSDTNPASNPNVNIQQYVRRSANAGVLSLWGRFQWQKLRLEAEAVGIVGKIDGTATSSNGLDSAPGYLRYTDQGQNPIWQDANFCEGGICNAPLIIFQGALAFESSYKFLNDSLVVGLNGGMASGDDSPGWGLRSVFNSNPEPGDFDGRQYGECFEDREDVDGTDACPSPDSLDNFVTNYKFDPDYLIDLILFREILGTVTNAAYIKPHVSYYLTETIGARADLIYSHALFASSTTGAANVDGAIGAPMGLELDGTLFYGSDDGFYLMGQAGVLFPFQALYHARDLDNPNQGRLFSNGTRVNSQFLDAQIAYTFQAFAGVQF